MAKISTHIEIFDGQVLLDDKPYFTSENQDFKAFSKALYQQLDISYPKFYKMDNLCKLAFLASEIILQQTQEKDIALIFGNKEGSLDSDLQHQALIQDPENYYPSPAVFVYTLPNICIGEVSIRHQLLTESMFLVADEYPIGDIADFTAYLLEQQKAKMVLCGWLKMHDNSYSASFYLVSTSGSLAHNEKNIHDIVHKKA